MSLMGGLVAKVREEFGGAVVDHHQGSSLLGERPDNVGTDFSNDWPEDPLR